MKSKYANQGTQYPRSSVLDILRTLGEYFYRRGQVYQASERLIPLNPREALREHGRLVILGSPGAGKSTLLRYLAREAAKDPNSPVPVLIRLRDYATALSQDRTLALRDFALREVAGGDKQLDWVLEEEAKESRVLWLIDGLDETRGWQERTSHQANQLPGRLVVTSRPVGYQQIGLESLSHFEILPLIPEDVDQFLHDWFGVLAEQRGTNSDWVGERIAWLKKQIEQRPRIQPLTRNPLLLTFMVILAGEDHELPAQRAALYRRYVDDLLDSWELYRRPQGGPEGKSTFALGSLTGNDARRAARQGFYYLGWHLHLTYYGGHGEDNRFNRHTPEGALADYYLNNRDRHLSVNESQALASEVLEFWLEAGILDIWRIEGEEYLAFRHMTFQEYAAACMLASAWEKNPQSVWRETLCPILHHYAWREPIFLLAGLLDPSHFNGLVRRLLGDTSKYERYLHRDLRLAAAFIGESGIGAEGASSRGFDFVDPRLTKKILSGLRWLILYRGSAIWKQKVTLWAAYFLGVMTIWSTLSSWWLCSAELL